MQFLTLTLGKLQEKLKIEINKNNVFNQPSIEATGKANQSTGR